MGWPKIFT